MGKKKIIDLYLDKIKKESALFSHNIGQLRIEKLKNPNLPEKVYAIMQGNRESYTNKAEMFNSKIILPENYDFEVCINFANNLLDSINEFGEESAKSFYVLKEFFNDNLSEISTNIRNFRNYAESIKKELAESQEANIGLIKENISKLKAYNSHLKNASSEITIFQESIKKLQKEVEQLNEKINALRNSHDYALHEKNLARKEMLEEQLKDSEKKIRELFAQLERPLRKYEKISLEEKEVQRYLENPVLALEQDKKLVIINILNSMLNALETKKLDLNDEKKQEKTIEILKATNKDLIKQLHDNIINLRIDLEAVNKMIKDAPVISAIKDIEYKKEHIEEQIKRQMTEIDNIKKHIEKIDMDALQEQIKSKIKELLGIETEIILPQKPTVMDL